MVWERVFILLHVFTVFLLMVVGLTTITLLHAFGRILRRIKGRYYVLITDEGPAIHAPLPEFDGYTPEGQLVRSRDFAGSEIVLLLVSPECAPCHTVVAAIEPVKRGWSEPPSFVVVAECSTELARQYARRYRLQGTVLADPEGIISSRLGVRRTPYGFLVDGRGIVRMKGVVNHADQLEALCLRRGRSIGSLLWESPGESDADVLKSLAAPTRGKEYRRGGSEIPARD